METIMQQRAERPPPLKIQFGQGHYAFSRGWLNNQYDPESVAGKEWQRGFDAAYFDNLSRITKS
jgi:hypothetical protein